MSTQPNLIPQWKEEVNRRVAAHKNRRGSIQTHDGERNAATGNSLAAQAAARVAARYAKAPSYSQMQAEEARVAVRHAEIATKVALEAQAAAETALAELHAASQESNPRGPAVVQSIAQPVRKPEPAPEPVHPQVQEPQVQEPEVPHVEMKAAEPVQPQPEAVAEPKVYGIRWDPDLPVRAREIKAPSVQPAPEAFELSVEDWWSPAEAVGDLRDNPIEVGEPESAYANLIQFPRELVATRKMRPRLAEAGFAPAVEDEGQLSIFEVDPGAVSTEVEVPAEGRETSAPAWNQPEWSGMRLDNRTEDVPAPASPAAAVANSLPVASIGSRLMAVVVDFTLILASFVTAGFIAAHYFHEPPTGKPAELLGVVAMAAIGLLYYALFFALPASTPGMKYAGIGLCTFDEQTPTRAQLWCRLGAMVLSVLPVGLGLVWSIFDDEHLSWHDRCSQTYLRKC